MINTEPIKRLTLGPASAILNSISDLLVSPLGMKHLQKEKRDSLDVCTVFFLQHRNDPVHVIKHRQKAVSQLINQSITEQCRFNIAKTKYGVCLRNVSHYGIIRRKSNVQFNGYSHYFPYLERCIHF